MRLIKTGIFLSLLAASFTSCLKSKNDFAGLRTDEGNIVTSITEKQYINTDDQNGGNGYWNAFANFSFAAPATEEVRFFTLHISQPRVKKLSGPLLVKISIDSLVYHGAATSPTPIYRRPPAGAITIPTEISVPLSSAAAFDYPVKFSVNKAGFNANLAYGATFTITAVNQGIYSELDKTVDVVFNYDPAYNTSRYTARYKWTSTVVDPAKQYGITNNTKPVLLEENSANRLDIYDFYAGSASLYANNLTTGANTVLFAPRYVLDATGKVTSITVQSTNANLTVTNLALDAASSNQFTYTANDTRTMTVKYSFTLTSVISGVSTPRTVVVTDSFTYDQTQVFN